MKYVRYTIDMSMPDSLFNSIDQVSEELKDAILNAFIEAGNWNVAIEISEPDEVVTREEYTEPVGDPKE